MSQNTVEKISGKSIFLLGLPSRLRILSILKAAEVKQLLKVGYYLLKDTPPQKCLAI